MRRIFFLFFLALTSAPAQHVYVSRMWHNHQPIYWPEWNTNGGENSRIEYAWDSISLKFNRSYLGSDSRHPENNLENIFGLDDRRNAYQARPRNSLASTPNTAGFCLSYSGSLIDNVRQLGGGGHLGYSSNWWDGNREARNWTTPSGSRRLDLVGFTYHHSLAPLLPKAVLRKEIQTFKQAYWKAWGGNSDLSDHSKGFFPTEMAFSRHLVDVLVDEGYEWSIVASHHLSRTCPTYFDAFDLANGSYGIYSSPPNRADLLGPSPKDGWWYSEPNPGNAARNVAPFAYQLHRVEYIDPNSGNKKSLIVVPSDDVLSYRYGYANEGTGKIYDHIAPFANDPNRPALVMPSTDGDNAWGGGFSSWLEATPQLFNSGIAATAVQDFVNQFGGAADTVHIEDGAWIFPESDYGSPYFLKWIEPPVAAPEGSRYPGTIVDMETPGFALKFWSWAPIITGANWCETAEQILKDEGGTVEAWKIQAPYDWDGTWTSPNEVELAWHIYLGGLDSGFNYYGGLGNDDEVKPSLAATRAMQQLQPWMNSTRREQDRTPPSVLKPQRFPHNPGGYTFGWFNSIPGGDTNYLKKMPSDFYIWTHAYDLSGIDEITLKVRVDADGRNSMNSTDNETYAGGPEVGAWIDIALNKRQLPNDQESLNAAASNGEINYFITPPELADYYVAKISDSEVPGFRGKLLDYYIEASDSRGNLHRSEIQHVFVEDDGGGQAIDPPVAPGAPVIADVTATTASLTWGPVAGATSYQIFRNGSFAGESSVPNWQDNGLLPSSSYSYHIVARNSGGESAPGPASDIETPPATGPIPFVMDGVADSSGYLLSNTGMTLYAALRGNILYLATWAPGDLGNDHFLLISNGLEDGANLPTPWSKAGTSALPAGAPFVGAEADNSYIGWFNTNGATTNLIRGMPGGQMEASINLEQAFGEIPNTLYLASAAFQSEDNGLLASQTPASTVNESDLDPDEFLMIATEALRDENANGTFDRLEASADFRITRVTREGDDFTITWNCFPSRRYHLEYSNNLAPGSWTLVDGSETTAPADSLSLSAAVQSTHQAGYYRIVLEP